MPNKLFNTADVLAFIENKNHEEYNKITVLKYPVRYVMHKRETTIYSDYDMTTEKGVDKL